MDKNKARPKTCFELRAALGELGIMQSQLAMMCGVKEVQVWRWCEGKTVVPRYVWTILTLFQNEPMAALEVQFGELASWPVHRRDVYRAGKDFKTLAKRFHPDATRRDTTTEMQIINRLRSK